MPVVLNDRLSKAFQIFFYGYISGIKKAVMTLGSKP
jgi:hypothetical protein